MDLSKYIKDACKIFSDDGLTLGMMKITCPKDCTVSISNTGESSLRISFQSSKPRVKIKFVSVTLAGIHLNENGGVLEIENFPDIPFKYSQIFE